MIELGHWRNWKTFLSVLIEGAMTKSILCMLRKMRAPTTPKQVRRAPNQSGCLGCGRWGLRTYAPGG